MMAGNKLQGSLADRMASLEKQVEDLRRKRNTHGYGFVTNSIMGKLAEFPHGLTLMELRAELPQLAGHTFAGTLTAMRLRKRIKTQLNRHGYLVYAIAKMNKEGAAA